MAAEEWIVMAKRSDGSYLAVARPVVESAFEALQATPAEVRTAEMYTVKAAKIDAWILVPEANRPVDATMVSVLADGTLAKAVAPANVP